MSLYLKLKKSLERAMEGSKLKDASFRRRLILALVLISITLILVVDFIPQTVDLEEGEVSRTDLAAPHTVTFIDQERTDQLRQEAADAIPRIYEEVVGVSNEVEEELDEFFQLIREYRAKREEMGDELERIRDLIATNGDLELEEGDLFYQLRQELPFQVSDQALYYSLVTKPGDLSYIEEKSGEILLSYLRRGIRNDQLDRVKEQLSEEVYNYNLLEENEIILEEVVLSAQRPNFLYNAEETEQRRQEAKEAVEPVERTIRQGEIIVRQGEVVTEEHLLLLEEVGLKRPQVNFRTILGLTLIVIIMLSIVVYYLHHFQSSFLEQEEILILISILSVMILILARVFTLLALDDPWLLIPVASVSMLITILINSHLALVIIAALSFLVGIVSGGGLVSVAVAFVGGIAGIFSVSRVSQRSDLVRAGFYVGLASALTAIGFSLTDSPISLFNVLKLSFMGIINGVIAAILTNGFLPFLENYLGMVSAIKLLELSNPNHPLLRRLLMEAPGTYHHSVIIGNLAEAAAENVGADSLLTRVGAYYHDIGKIKRPYFFTENQLGSRNPHDKITPNLSTLIIKSHVKDGVELAVKYRLPEPIIDIIHQHHGTSLVSFFYEEAKHDQNYKHIEEQDFCYEGPKPRTKEAALIMLADIVEAKVRSESFDHSNQGRIEGIIQEMIKEKLYRGQLDHCDLTLKELDQIKESFVKVFSGIFHQRVEYPDLDGKKKQ